MDPQLIITIDYERELRAEDLGSLFSALAKDYKTVSGGRILVVASIDRGSLIAKFVDWALVAVPYVKGTVEFAKGAKTLADFAKLLKNGIQSVTSPSSTQLPQPSSGKRSVSRSVKALVEMAAKNGCSIHIKHTHSDGEIFEVDMTAPQAVEFRTATIQSAEATLKLGALEATQQPVALSVPTGTMQLPSISHAIDRLYAPSAAAYSATEVQTLVDSLFEILQATKLTHLVPQLAADLSQKGLHTIAAALQAKMQGWDRNSYPLLGPA